MLFEQLLKRPTRRSNNLKFLKKTDCVVVFGVAQAVLHGAVQTIRRYRLKLALCGYLKAEDLLTIPLSINLDYKFYLRKYIMPFSCELIFYAI